jgi:hypothetical protein
MFATLGHALTPRARQIHLNCLSHPRQAYNMVKTCRICGHGVGAMDELIGRLVADIGIDRAAAETAVGIILDFLVKEGPADKVQPLLAKLPGAEALIQKAANQGGGGLMGGAMGGVMGAGMRMMSAGLSMGQVQSVTQAVIAYTRDKAGEDAVGEIVAAIPGLAQFV